MADQASQTQGTTFMEWMMGIGEVERRLIGADPRLRQEIGFQFIALLLCPPALGYAIYKVAVSLFGMSQASGMVLAGLVAFGLFILDRYYLVQARGDSSPTVRRGIYKIRAISVAMIAIAFIMTAADTFHKEIGQVLEAAKLARRAELEQSLRYKLEWEEAHAALQLAAESAKRAEAVQSNIARLKVDHARALEEHRNQCEGNTTGNETRKVGCGPKARGALAAANRMGLEIQAAQQDFEHLGDVHAKMAAARAEFERIDATLDQEAQRSVGGAPQKMDALVLMLAESWTARVVVAFWFLIGLVPDLLMFVAQGRMFNHPQFVAMRQLQNEAVMSRLAQIRRDLRQEQADMLLPVDIRLTPMVPPGKDEASVEIRPEKSETAN